MYLIIGLNTFGTSKVFRYSEEKPTSDQMKLLNKRSRYKYGYFKIKRQFFGDNPKAEKRKRKKNEN
jgi:hypothetical protein